ncbi:MAG TPA: HAD family hydrolase [Polyangiaceae bacterium]|nr:HAD family hydrolase [Polyangiaceae bacterium]
MSFRLLAVDLDGTLVDAAGAVHAPDREAIAALALKGIPTTIITGRLFSGTRHIASDVGTHGAVACVDGCHLVEVASGADLLHGSIVAESAAALRDLLERHRVTTFVFANDQILYDDEGAPHLPYVRTWSLDHVRTERVTVHPHWEHARGITAVVSLGTERAIRELELDLGRALGQAVYTAAFPVRRLQKLGTWALVARAAGYSKGTALVWLARHHGVSPEEVVAVGDWFNDIPMFAAAGRSFVMAQAPEDVKQAATDRLDADSSTGGGIAEAALRAGLL